MTGHALGCDKPAADPSRIAIAGGSITEILYFLGAESHILAVDRTSNFPAEAMQFPSVGYVRNLSTEGLLSLNPTLVLGEDDMGPPEVLAQIRRTGVEVVKIPEGHSAAGIEEKVRCIARVLDIEARAEREIRERLTPLRNALDSLANRRQLQKPRVAVVLGLRDGTPLGAGADTSGHGLLGMAAASNVFADFEGWKPISMEAMVRADPEFIVIPQRGVDDAGGIDGILGHPAIRLTTAGKKRRLIALDGMSMLGFGPRTLDSALELARRLHGDSVNIGGAVSR